jgi:hypothetical protein
MFWESALFEAQPATLTTTEASSKASNQPELGRGNFIKE